MIFPADPELDLASMLDASPSLSRFSALLRENGLLPLYSSFPSPSSSFRSKRGGPASSGSAGGTAGEAAVRGGDNGGESWEGREGRNSELGGNDKTAFTTMFAPTNTALNLLEKQRPWLFQNSTAAAAAAGGGAAGGGDGLGEGIAGGEAGDGGVGKWSPVRELLAYHLVPGATLFSRYARTAGGERVVRWEGRGGGGGLSGG